MGQAAGEEAHTLTIPEMPTHNHTLSGSGATGNLQKPFNNSPAVAPASVQMYGPYQNQGPMSNAVVGMTGGSLAHENRQPFLVINWVIALVGVFPSQT
jgi:microcystin-dependent protein